MLREGEALERADVAGIALRVLAQLGDRLVDATRLEVLVGRGEQIVRHDHSCNAPLEAPSLMAAASPRKRDVIAANAGSPS
jgi:hypothetical protein